MSLTCCFEPCQCQGIAQQYHHQQHRLCDVQLCTLPVPMQIRQLHSQQTGLPALHLNTHITCAKASQATHVHNGQTATSCAQSGECIYLDSIAHNVSPSPFKSSSGSDLEEPELDLKFSSMWFSIQYTVGLIPMKPIARVWVSYR